MLALDGRMTALIWTYVVKVKQGVLLGVVLLITKRVRNENDVGLLHNERVVHASVLQGDVGLGAREGNVGGDLGPSLVDRLALRSKHLIGAGEELASRSKCESSVIDMVGVLIRIRGVLDYVLASLVVVLEQVSGHLSSTENDSLRSVPEPGIVLGDILQLENVEGNVVVEMVLVVNARSSGSAVSVAASGPRVQSGAIRPVVESGVLDSFAVLLDAEVGNLLGELGEGQVQ